MSDPFPPPRHAVPGQEPPGYQQPFQVQPYQQPYQQQVVMAPVALVPTSGLATAAMICGIAALFTCGLASIPAVICGHMAIRETSTGRRGGHGLAVTGLILGYLTLVPWIVFWSMVLLGMVSAPFTAP